MRSRGKIKAVIYNIYNNNMNRLSILIFVLIAIAACSPKLSKGIFSVEEGIAGKVLWKQGNFMPSPDRPQINSGMPVEKELLVYNVTNLKQVKVNGAFYSDVQTGLVARVKSTPTGYFELKLPPGKYSLFSVEPDGLFANRFDGSGNINVVEVKGQTLTNIDFIIDYKAAY